MRKKAMLIALALALLLMPASLAQDDDKPTVAMLRFGPHLSYDLVDFGVLSGLMAEGMINADEHAILAQDEDLDGERIRVIWRDAGFDFANTIVMVENAIDAGADVLVTYSTPVTQAAALVTSDMDDPPPVIFTSVFDPFAAGIAEASCVKPAHITGVELVTPYEDIVPLLLLQNPDLKVIGTLHSSSEASGAAGSRQIIEVATALGLEVKEAAVAGISELALAAEGLVEKGAEALIIPADMTTVSALPVIVQVAAENQIPVFHSVALSYNDGATVSAGPTRPTSEGGMVAGILVGHLEGSLNIATTGIGTIREMTVNINQDSADMQGVTVSDALMSQAFAVIHEGVSTNMQMMRHMEEMGLEGDELEAAMQALSRTRRGPGVGATELSPKVQEIVAKVLAAGRQQANIGALLAELHCTDEMIAEQQAELDAAGG